ncbi:MAG TPA: S41 family peptidase [Gemmatimonadaceae bacterium]|nr:S41 family peptidase [Gemmatimonadaceae bacterium]
MRTLLLVPLVLSLGAAASPRSATPKPRALVRDSALVAQAWAAIRDRYGDTTFGGRDWRAVGDSFVVRRSYADVRAQLGAIREMLSRLHDPWTRLLRAEDFDALLGEASGGAHVGVGLPELLCIDFDRTGRELVVVTPVPGTAAARAGLRPGDVVTRIGTRRAAGLSLSEAAWLLRGARGSGIAVRVRRGGREHTVRLVRDSVPARRPAATGRLVGGPDGVGYLALGWFTGSAGDEVRGLVDSLMRAGARRLVLDLRGNPGGSLAAAADVAGVFLGDVPIVSVVGRGAGGQEVRGTAPALTRAPMAVLIDRGTASAAEVVASALQHHRRAVLVGERSFGKGLVHSFERLPDGSALMLTSGRLHTPGGRDILALGVEPDVVAPAERQMARAMEAVKGE